MLLVVVNPEELHRVLGEHRGSAPRVSQSVLTGIDANTVQGTVDLGNSHAEHLLAAHLLNQGSRTGCIAGWMSLPRGLDAADEGQHGTGDGHPQRPGHQSASSRRREQCRRR